MKVESNKPRPSSSPEKTEGKKTEAQKTDKPQAQSTDQGQKAEQSAKANEPKKSEPTDQKRGSTPKPADKSAGVAQAGTNYVPEGARKPASATTQPTMTSAAPRRTDRGGLFKTASHPTSSSLTAKSGTAEGAKATASLQNAQRSSTALKVTDPPADLETKTKTSTSATSQKAANDLLSPQQASGPNAKAASEQVGVTAAGPADQTGELTPQRKEELRRESERILTTEPRSQAAQELDKSFQTKNTAEKDFMLQEMAKVPHLATSILNQASNLPEPGRGNIAKALGGAYDRGAVTEADVKNLVAPHNAGTPENMLGLASMIASSGSRALGTAASQEMLRIAETDDSRFKENKAYFLGAADAASAHPEAARALADSLANPPSRMDTFLNNTLPGNIRGHGDTIGNPALANLLNTMSKIQPASPAADQLYEKAKAAGDQDPALQGALTTYLASKPAGPDGLTPLRQEQLRAEAQRLTQTYPQSQAAQDLDNSLATMNPAERNFMMQELVRSPHLSAGIFRATVSLPNGGQNIAQALGAAYDSNKISQTELNTLLQPEYQGAHANPTDMATLISKSGSQRMSTDASSEMLRIAESDTSRFGNNRAYFLGAAQAASGHPEAAKSLAESLNNPSSRMDRFLTMTRPASMGARGDTLGNNSLANLISTMAKVQPPTPGTDTLFEKATAVVDDNPVMQQAMSNYFQAHTDHLFDRWSAKGTQTDRAQAWVNFSSNVLFGPQFAGQKALTDHIGSYIGKLVEPFQTAPDPATLSPADRKQWEDKANRLGWIIGGIEKGLTVVADRVKESNENRDKVRDVVKDFSQALVGVAGFHPGVALLGEAIIQGANLALENATHDKPPAMPEGFLKVKDALGPRDANSNYQYDVRPYQDAFDRGYDDFNRIHNG